MLFPDAHVDADVAMMDSSDDNDTAGAPDKMAVELDRNDSAGQGRVPPGEGQVAGSLADSPGSRGVQHDPPPHRVDVGGRSGQRDIAGGTAASRMACPHASDIVVSDSHRAGAAGGCSPGRAGDGNDTHSRDAEDVGGRACDGHDMDMMAGVDEGTRAAPGQERPERPAPPPPRASDAVAAAAGEPGRAEPTRPDSDGNRDGDHGGGDRGRPEDRAGSVRQGDMIGAGGGSADGPMVENATNPSLPGGSHEPRPTGRRVYTPAQLAKRQQSQHAAQRSVEKTNQLHLVPHSK